MTASDLAAWIERNRSFDAIEAQKVNDLVHAFAPEPKVIQPLNYLRSIDAAESLLLGGPNSWRKFTHDSAAVYAANPYNANAQKRYDGYAVNTASSIVAAFLKMVADKR